MRVLMLSMDQSPWADTPMELPLAEELVRLGHEVELHLDADRIEFVQNPYGDKLRIHATPLNSAPGGLGLTMGADCDVAFATSVSGAPILAEWGKLRGKPTVAQVLDVPLWRLRSAAVTQDRHGWLGKWRMWVQALSRTSRLLCNAERTRSDLEEACLVFFQETSKLPPSSVAHYGVNTAACDHASVAELNPQGRAIIGRNGYALTVSRLVHYKGIELAMRGLGKMPHHERPNYLVIGEGPDHDRLLEHGAMGGASAVFIGSVPETRKWMWIKGSRLGFALNWNPHVGMQYALESAYAGIPCIASDTGLNRERLGKAVGNGIRLVDPFDASEVRWAAQQLLLSGLRVPDETRSWIREHRSVSAQARGLIQAVKET